MTQTELLTGPIRQRAVTKIVFVLMRPVKPSNALLHGTLDALILKTLVSGRGPSSTGYRNGRVTAIFGRRLEADVRHDAVESDRRRRAASEC